MNNSNLLYHCLGDYFIRTEASSIYTPSPRYLHLQNLSAKTLECLPLTDHGGRPSSRVVQVLCLDLLLE